MIYSFKIWLDSKVNFQEIKIINKQKCLNLKDECFQVGYVCGDDRDLINGRLIGFIRIFFGYMFIF